MDSDFEKTLSEGVAEDESTLNGLWGRLSDPSDANYEKLKGLVDGIATGGSLLNDDRKYLTSVVISIGAKTGLMVLGLSITHYVCDGYTHYLFLKILMGYIGEELGRVRIGPGPEKKILSPNSTDNHNASDAYPDKITINGVDSENIDTRQITPLPHLGNEREKVWLP